MLAMAVVVTTAQPVAAGVLSAPIPTDVTPRAMSVVWVVSEAVLSAGVRLYTDADGQDEITDNGVVQQVLIGSDAAPNRAAQLALENGVVKVNITGLQPDTTYYLETSAETAGGGIETSPPPSSPLVEVRTAVATVKAKPSSQEIIVNDVIVHRAVLADGETPAEGSIVVLSAPDISDYPLTAFVGDGAAPDQALIDLNNLYGVDGLSAEVLADTRLNIRTLRGLNCIAEPDDHEIAVNRRAPIHEEFPPVTQLEGSAPCFSPDGFEVDHDCDGRIGTSDINIVLSRFRAAAPSCRFNAALDLNDDGRVGTGDITGVLNFFRRVEP
jgi:hypothetical protein